MDYDSQTLIQLKTLCKERGIRISGTKNEVVIRLMEDDESKSPQPISYLQPNPNQTVTQIIHINNNQNVVPILMGIGIIIYGLFRSYVGVVFSESWMGVEFFESAMAILLGVAYITCGIITVQGYREGLIGTLGVLLVSGTLSVIYHGEFSPLSMGMGDIFPLEWTLCCSATCMLIVGIPLLVIEDFKDGFPPIMSNLVGNRPQLSNSTSQQVVQKDTNEKIVISCTHCGKSLKVPTNFSGKVKCPMCNERFEV